jgi:hypothetical protein
MATHDLSLDLVATLIRCRRSFRRPSGILWDQIAPEKRDAIPVLKQRRRGERPQRARRQARDA